MTLVNVCIWNFNHLFQNSTCEELIFYYFMIERQKHRVKGMIASVSGALVDAIIESQF